MAGITIILVPFSVGFLDKNKYQHHNRHNRCKTYCFGKDKHQFLKILLSGIVNTFGKNLQTVVVHMYFILA